MCEVSVIVTTYNAEDTVHRTISSLLRPVFQDKVEIIIVDDASSDRTPQIIKDYEKQYANIRAILLKENTGSPSEPRNVGIQAATCEYIAFLDDDDWVDIRTLCEMVSYAQKNNLEGLKGYLHVVDDTGCYEVNRLVRKNENIMNDIISQQSTTIDIILKRNFLLEHKIEFHTDLKIGEDTVFYADLFCSNIHLEYINKSYYFYNKLRGLQLSTTQQYSDKELLTHLEVWDLVEKKMNEIGKSYFQLRLPIAIKNSIKSLVGKESICISENTFQLFSEFLQKNKNIWEHKVALEKRFQKILDAIAEGDYIKFKELRKKCILVAGYDLKFIMPIVPYLEKQYTVLVDEWIGHDKHDVKKSGELLERADIIWCEWLLGNAVWYTAHKQKYQKIIIRAHRFEITREFGYQVDYNKVNKVLVVGYYYLEEFQRKFNIPRNKMQLLSNYVESKIYTGKKNDGYKYTIGLVGSVPKLKGFYRALEILNALHNKDRRFNLLVVGKKANEFSWVMNNPTEKEYYEICEKYIIENALEECIKYTGSLPKERVFENIGYVLSVSDLESFHLAVAEAYCDNSVGLAMPWAGVEYIYPDEIICQTTSEIADIIFELSVDETKYNELSNEMKKFILANYDISVFCYNTVNILEAL